MPADVRHPRPSIAVDIILLQWDGATLSVPLVQRGSAPFKGWWALPGGFMEIEETLEAAARRELSEETALQAANLLRGPVFDQVDRDPRGRVLSVPHVTLVTESDTAGAAGSDAAGLESFPLSSLPEQLAFDHHEIIRVMCGVAVEGVRNRELGGELSPGGREALLEALTKCTE